MPHVTWFANQEQIDFSELYALFTANSLQAVGVAVGERMIEASRTKGLRYFDIRDPMSNHRFEFQPPIDLQSVYYKRRQRRALSAPSGIITTYVVGVTDGMLDYTMELFENGECLLALAAGAPTWLN